MLNLFTRKTPSKDGKKPEEEKNLKPLPTDADNLEMQWYGLQYIRKVRGTLEIQQRSFPFWLTTTEEGIRHAQHTNSLPKEQRTYWTHMVIWASITETKTGRRTNPTLLEELKI